MAEAFRLQEIDGQALLLLTEDHLMTSMNIKLGPALKICAHINALKNQWEDGGEPREGRRGGGVQEAIKTRNLETSGFVCFQRTEADTKDDRTKSQKEEIVGNL